ncbi:hypothetical protein [Bradyrhizobium sp. SRS-191]|uniref:hypothetical protein n=1 Tax=Bradyrhizobium sp. SRS-191 TaxID=2962606 RepID=UPI00211E639D|nr:hypothetical protein [Bradyrhizobium sp. SRS-191]
MTSRAPTSSTLRFRVDPADVPAEKAARRLHLTEAQFREKLPELLARGFPAADPTTGMFDLEAIDRWRAERHRGRDQALPELTSAPPSLQPAASDNGPGDSLGRVERFCAAKERQTAGRRRHGGAA